MTSDGTVDKTTAAATRGLLPRWRYAIAAAVLCSGILMSVALFLTLRGRERDRMRADFERAAEDRVSALEKGIEFHSLILDSVALLHAASHEVERSEFRAFVTPLLKHHSHIRTLEWIPRVRDSQRSAYEAAARKDGYARFRITERNEQGSVVSASRREEYFPVLFVEPYEGNEAALGCDLACDPKRLEVLKRSRDTGKVTATSGITLVREAGNPTGLLVFVPVYRNGAPAKTTEDRRENLEGFILGVFRIAEMLEDTLAHLAPADIDIHIFDDSDQAGEELVFSYPGRTRESAVAPSDRRDVNPESGLLHTAVFGWGGQRWSVVCTPTSGFVASRTTWHPWVSLSGGLVLAALLATYLWSIAAHSARTERLAQKLLKANRELESEVTRRKRAQEELRESRDRLEQGVAERTRDLVEANGQLRQAQSELVQAEKLSMLGQLVAGIAHEINTPTGAIINVTATMQEHLSALIAPMVLIRRLPEAIGEWLSEASSKILSSPKRFGQGEANAERRRKERELRDEGAANYRRIAAVMIGGGLGGAEYSGLAVESLSEEPVLAFLEHLLALKASSEISHASAQKIARIVRALGHYSRSGEGEMFSIDINESIENTLVILHNRIRLVATVRTDFQRPLPVVRCGPDISQVWTNIISNACDAIEESLSAGVGRIDIATRTEDGRLLVTISNHARPIPEDTLSRIFDPFFTTKPIGKGTGLGLGICAGILKRYGGTVTARNEPGRVTFCVSLPTAPPDEVDEIPSSAVLAGHESAHFQPEGHRQ